MGIFTSTESRAQQRTDLYAARRGNRHGPLLLSLARPEVDSAGRDGRQLVAALPVDALRRQLSGKAGRPAPAQCTDAAWSPDGKWMYFTANAGNGYHVWRQSFPDGRPEQVTSGATQEEGIAFAPDGHSFVTAIGKSQSTLWFHDARGDRQITSEGFALFPPSLSMARSCITCCAPEAHGAG